MPELIPTASESEWLDARRKGVTASEIAVIMGLSPYSSPYALYHQKLGILPADGDQAVFERGRVLEPYVAEKFAAAHPDFAVLGDGRGLYAHSERPWQLATPDRVIGEVAEVDGCTCGQGPNGYYGAHERGCGTELAGPVAVLECKTDAGSDEWGEPGTDEIPVHYRCQALWQMDVMGVPTAHVSCLDPARWQIREYVIEHEGTFDAELGCADWPYPQPCAACTDLDRMRREALLFLQRMEDGEPPEVDWRPATASALRALYPDEEGGDIAVRPSLAISYAAAVRRYKAADRRMDEMSAAVLEIIGNRRRAIDPRTGEPIATRSVSHPQKVSVTLVRERYPGIAAECTPDPKPVIKLLPAKPKKGK